MANVNTFPEDICLAIKELLSNPPITVPDEAKDETPITTTIMPRYINPEVELVDLDYPSLVFYESLVEPDLERREQGHTIKDNLIVDSEGDLLSLDVRDVPEPYTVYIDIRACTVFDQQRDIIRKEILKRLKGPFGVLVVNGVPINYQAYPESKIPLPSLGGMPESKEQRRRITQWRFRFATRFDLSTRSTVKVVRDVIVTPVSVIEGG